MSQDDELSTIQNRNPALIHQNEYIKAATSDNTRLAYRSDVRHFEHWGGLLPSNTESIIQYLHFYATRLSPRTLIRRITALKQWHHYQGFPDPTQHPSIKKMLIGIQRIHGKPKRKAHPLSISELEILIDHLNKKKNLAACRDKAIILVGYFGALRRSELVHIHFEDLNWVEEGVDMLIRRSKTDPLQEGQFSAIPYSYNALCPVTALKGWLQTAAITTGVIFRSIGKGERLSAYGLSGSAVNLILKKRANECGFLFTDYLSGHSFRRGLLTAASRAGAHLSSSMRQGRWKQVSSLQEYIDATERFTDNIATTVLSGRSKS